LIFEFFLRPVVFLITQFYKTPVATPAECLNYRYYYVIDKDKHGLKEK